MVPSSLTWNTITINIIRFVFTPWCHRQRAAPKDHNPLWTLAIYLLANAEDEDGEFIALGVARLAFKQEKARKNGKYGPRGPYNNSKSADFFDLLLYSFTDKQFKEWLRFVLEFDDLLLQTTSGLSVRLFGIYIALLKMTPSLYQKARNLSDLSNTSLWLLCAAQGLRVGSSHPP